MMWAAEWRITSSPSGLSSLIRLTLHTGGSGRWKSMTSPFTLAATTTLARPLEIDSATWRALVPSGNSLTAPSGNVTFTDIREGNPTGTRLGSQYEQFLKSPGPLAREDSPDPVNGPGEAPDPELVPAPRSQVLRPRRQPPFQILPPGAVDKGPVGAGKVPGGPG